MIRWLAEEVNLMKTDPTISEQVLSRLKPEVAAGISDYVRLTVSEFGKQIESITLYGSQARGDSSPDSDVDLFVIICQDSQKLRSRLADLAWQVQYEHNIIISDIIRSSREMKDSVALQFPYYRNIREEGIILWKSTSVLTPAYA